jgi:hypothetical protein
VTAAQRETAASIHRDQLIPYRARATHLDRKLPMRSIATAAWGGLQDSAPRSGVLSLHARVEGTEPGSWEHPSLVQIWFRGGADYIVPRDDVGIFTLGCLPRDEARIAQLERVADQIHAAANGARTPVGEVAAAIGHRSAADPFHPRVSSTTGRVHIRWDASRIWLIPVERPGIDPEDARRELARRFLHWLGPSTAAGLARWTGVKPADARATWAALEAELTPVELDAEVRDRKRFILTEDLDALEGGDPIEGARLLPFDDPFTKLDKELLVPDPRRRLKSVPASGHSPGYIPGAMLLDGVVVGGWQRQGRRVRLHPFERLDARARELFEAEALSVPIAGPGAASATWEP